MSGMLRRPAARFVIHPRPEGASGRVTGKTAGAIVTGEHAYGGAQRGVVDPTSTFHTTYLDFLQLNPAHEQPKLIFNSGAQPIIRWGVRRFVRTYMSAGPRFLGRYAYVGVLIRTYTERTRMTGVVTRQGTTYRYPRPRVGPRVIQLGGGGPD